LRLPPHLCFKAALRPIITMKTVEVTMNITLVMDLVVTMVSRLIGELLTYNCGGTPKD
jgi:hypothetical protein